MSNSNSEYPIKVMVVDDSSIMRGTIAAILGADSDMEVTAAAGDGKIAIDTLKRDGDNRIDVDVVTLDVEMPNMDGLEALPEIQKLRPDAKVIMVSSLTSEKVEVTLKALAFGAADYLVKPLTREDRESFQRELLEKVRTLGNTVKGREVVPGQPVGKPEHQFTLRKKSIAYVPKILAIGSSTGGPQALVQLFTALAGKNIKVPILITQHMPPKFTTMLAKQIEEASGLRCAEAQDGETVVPGRIYLAPGDYHMTLEGAAGNCTVALNQEAPENFCRPAVDPMLRSLTQVYGHSIMAVILTGMGADGLEGCRKITEDGGTVLAQDEASSVVWGMPGAVALDGLCMGVEPIDKLHEIIIELAQGQIL